MFPNLNRLLAWARRIRASEELIVPASSGDRSNQASLIPEGEQASRSNDRTAAIAELAVPVVAPSSTGRIIVHIGVHKTGSTAIQRFLHRNANNLAAMGVHYAPTLPDLFPNHNPLGAAFLPGAQHGVGEDGLKYLLDRAGPKTVLISSEMLCHPLVDIARFMAGLDGRTVDVIAYIRHPGDLLISAFNERVRDYKTLYVRGLEERPLAYDVSHLTHLRPWIEHRGTRVVLAPYDAAQWSGGSIFTDFLATAQIPFDGLEIGDERVNESLPLAAIEMLRALNMTSPSQDKHRSYIEELRGMDFAPGDYPLSEALGLELLERMRTALPELRPYFRPGFREEFLLAPRRWKVEGRAS